jgi:hypothetical protein
MKQTDEEVLSPELIAKLREVVEKEIAAILRERNEVKNQGG